MAISLRVLVLAGKKVPTELRYEAEKLKHTVDMEDETTKEMKVGVCKGFSEIDACGR